MEQRLVVRQSFKVAYPVMLSFIPLGLACGMVLNDAGFSPLAIFVMSLLVFAGSSQFMVASMVLTGATVPTMIVMTFFLNLRHVLMSSSLAQYFKKSKKAFILLFTHTMVDESYAVNCLQFKNSDWATTHALMTNRLIHVSWIVSSTVGGLIGGFVTVDTVVMNYVLIALFICLLVMQFTSWVFVLVAGISGFFTIVFMELFKHNISLIVATLVASTFGFFIQQYVEKKKGKVSM